MVDINHLATDEVGWDEKMFSMNILGEHDWYLPTKKEAEQNRVVAGVCIVILRFWWGAPWWQMVDINHLATDEVGWDKQMFYMTILGKHDWYLSN